MLLTEQQNPLSAHLDQLSTLEIVKVMNEEDQKVALAVQEALPSIAQAVDGMLDRKQRGGRIFYIGAGTSGRLGVLDAVECVPTFGTDPHEIQAIIAGGIEAMLVAVEGAEDDTTLAQRDLEARGITSEDVVVGIAASGATPYVMGGMAFAKALGCFTVGLSCNAPAPLLESVDVPIALLVGAEVLTGSTRLKAGTAQKMALNMLSTALMVRSGKVYGNLMVDVQITNKKLANRAERIVMQISGVSQETAQVLLAQCSGSAKVAIVMAKRQVDPATARQLLSEANGQLRKVID